MNKNVLELADAVLTTIRCDYCDEEFGDFCGDVLDCAEAADEAGWKVNKSGKVKCTECVNKMSKK